MWTTGSSSGGGGRGPQQRAGPRGQSPPPAYSPPVPMPPARPATLPRRLTAAAFSGGDGGPAAAEPTTITLTIAAGDIVGSGSKGKRTAKCRWPPALLLRADSLNVVCLSAAAVCGQPPPPPLPPPLPAAGAFQVAQFGVPPPAAAAGASIPAAGAQTRHWHGGHRSGEDDPSGTANTQTHQQQQQHILLIPSASAQLLPSVGHRQLGQLAQPAPPWSHSQRLSSAARMACCFCCCPVFRCVLWFCALELLLSGCFWFNELNNLVRAPSAVELRDVLLLLLLSGWLLTLAVSTGSLAIAQRKREAQWVWPRMVQQSGLLILGFLVALFLALYFGGAAQPINNLLISAAQALFSDEPFSREKKRDLQVDFQFFFLFLILADFLFICYMSSALCATKKYYRELQMNGRPFQAVSQHDPSAPPPRQPPMNPHYYKGSV